MTVDEFDIQFDILYNNIASNNAPGLNNYEKSVFLSQAQKDIIIEMYNGRSIPGISFESTEEARAYLKPLTQRVNISTGDSNFLVAEKDFYSDFYIYSLDSEYTNKVLFFTMIEAIQSTSENLEARQFNSLVLPVRQDDLTKVFRNPYKRPSDTRVIRVDQNGQTTIYSKYPYLNIQIHYIMYPKPIILKNISDDTITIDDVVCTDDNNSVGSLPEILHKSVLDRAVALAQKTYIGNVQ